MKNAYVQTYVFPIIPLYEHRDCMKAGVNFCCLTEFFCCSCWWKGTEWRYGKCAY